MAKSKFILGSPRDLLTANHASPKFTPGKAVNEHAGTGSRYRYVKVTIGGTTATALVAGVPVYWDVQANGTVKTDTGGTEKNFAGVLLNTVTSGNYTWIQTFGPALCLAAANTPLNSPIIADSANGGLKVAAAATDVVLGTTLVATGASSATVPVTVFLAPAGG